MLCYNNIFYNNNFKNVEIDNKKKIKQELLLDEIYKTA